MREATCGEGDPDADHHAHPGAQEVRARREVVGHEVGVPRPTHETDESRDEGSAQEENGGRQHERRENRGARIEPGNPRTARPGLGHLPVRDE